MSGTEIAAEIAASLREASAETGGGSPLTVALLRTVGTPATPWATGAGTSTDYILSAVVSSYSSRLIDGENIRMGDRKVMVEAGVVVPTTADRIIIGATDYAIVSVQPLAPGGTDLAYTLQCRA